MDSVSDISDNPFAVWWQTWRWVALVGGGSLAAIVLSIVLLVKSTQTTHPIEFFSGSVLGASGSAELTVDVEGAVVNSGLQLLPQGSRVEDALAKAGGLLSSADTIYVSKVINRAQTVTDGMKLYIPFSSGDGTSHNNGQQTQSADTSYNIQTGNTADGQGQGPLISINSATVDELDSLSGVGPATAAKIIDNRPYQSIDDLLTKKVVGNSLFGKIHSRLSL
jgi:competence protein ComEA